MRKTLILIAALLAFTGIEAQNVIDVREAHPGKDLIFLTLAALPHHQSALFYQ